MANFIDEIQIDELESGKNLTDQNSFLSLIKEYIEMALGVELECNLTDSSVEILNESHERDLVTIEMFNFMVNKERNIEIKFVTFNIIFGSEMWVDFIEGEDLKSVEIKI